MKPSLMHGVFYSFAHTQTKGIGHQIASWVGIWKRKDPPLIRPEINGGPPFLIIVLTLTCVLPFNV